MTVNEYNRFAKEFSDRMVPVIRALFAAGKIDICYPAMKTFKSGMKLAPNEVLPVGVFANRLKAVEPKGALKDKDVVVSVLLTAPVKSGGSLSYTREDSVDFKCNVAIGHDKVTIISATESETFKEASLLGTLVDRKSYPPQHDDSAELLMEIAGVPQTQPVNAPPMEETIQRTHEKEISTNA